MSKSAWRSAVVVVAGLAVAAVLVLQPFSSPKPGRESLVGYFTDASPLVHGSQVRAAGVLVGNVERIDLDHGLARVTMGVDPAVLPLHRDASMRIRPVNLLGEDYVELNSGTPNQPLLSEPVIPVQQTSSIVTLQDVLNTFQDPTAASLAAMVTTLGKGMNGNGAEVAAATKALTPAFNDATRLGVVLRDQNEILNRVVDRLEPIASALATDNGKTLDQLVGSTERTLGTVAANRQAVNDSLVELPATLADARGTLRELAGAAQSATPTLKSIRPTTDQLPDIADELHKFSKAASPALRTLRPVIDHANALMREAATPVSNLRDAGPPLINTTAQLRPVGDQLLDDHLDDLLKFVTNWALATNGRDGLTHYFRGVAHMTPATAQEAVRGALAPPGLDTSVLPPQQNVPSLPMMKGTTTNGRQSGSATGLTPRQEGSMLDQLLGGG